MVGTEIIPVLDDNVQLSIEDYRQRLYKVELDNYKMMYFSSCISGYCTTSF